MSLEQARSVAEAIRAATQILGPRTDTARRDAELLMAHALGASRSELFLRRMGDCVPQTFAPLVARRAAHEPVAYILGHAHFWGLELEVSPAVLIPRADSETLIEAAQQFFALRPPARVLDLGTGSACLLLAALSQWSAASGVGIDRSAEALALAARNAARHGLEQRVSLFERDWTQPGWAAGLGRFDLILCNPPYVEQEAEIEPSVRDFEPAGALFAGPEGLDDYLVLIPELGGLLAEGGVAMVEIGAGQAGEVGALARAAGFDVTLHRDLAERPRALELKIPLGKGRSGA